MSSDDKIDKLNEAALAVTLCEKGASFHALFELCLSLGIHFPVPTFVRFEWKDGAVSFDNICPATANRYTLRKIIGADLVDGRQVHQMSVIMPRKTSSEIICTGTVDECIQSAEDHRNNQTRANLQ